MNPESTQSHCSKFTASVKLPVICRIGMRKGNKHLPSKPEFLKKLFYSTDFTPDIGIT